MQWSNSRVNESMLKNKRRQNFDLHNFAKGKSSTMQARRFLQFAALVCVVISSKAFWSWSAPSAKREIKTPVILGIVEFLILLEKYGSWRKNAAINAFQLMIW